MKYIKSIFVTKRRRKGGYAREKSIKLVLNVRDICVKAGVVVQYNKKYMKK